MGFLEMLLNGGSRHPGCRSPLGTLTAIPRAWGLTGCGSGGRKLALTLEAGQGVLFECAEFEASERQQVGREKHNPGSQKGGLAGDRDSWVEKSGCCQQGPRWDLGRPREWPGWGGGGGRGDRGGHWSTTCQEIIGHSFVQYLGQCQDIHTQERNGVHWLWVGHFQGAAVRSRDHSLWRPDS